jgi:hypothetical protein
MRYVRFILTAGCPQVSVLHFPATDAVAWLGDYACVASFAKHDGNGLRRALALLYRFRMGGYPVVSQGDLVVADRGRDGDVVIMACVRNWKGKADMLGGIIHAARMWKWRPRAARRRAKANAKRKAARRLDLPGDGTHHRVALSTWIR